MRVSIIGESLRLGSNKSLGMVEISPFSVDSLVGGKRPNSSRERVLGTSFSNRTHGFPSQKPSLSILIKVPPMICIGVLPDSHWISGEPSGQKSNVFRPFIALRWLVLTGGSELAEVARSGAGR